MKINQITYSDFQNVDIRVGKIIKAEDFPEAQIPAYKLTIDFGKEIGIKKTSARVVRYYKKQDLIGKLILAVINFPPKQIGPFMSEVLTLGVPDSEGECVLISPDSQNAVIGGRLF